MAQKEQWGSRLGVILAVAGSAVGLGNFLRFPGTAAQNGAGAFMIPYFCALIFLGIPLCWAEWIMGRHGGQKGYNSCPAIFGALGRKAGWRYMGVLGLVIPVGIYMYYVLIEAWCLGYAWCFLTGRIDLGQDPTQYAANASNFFNNFVGANEDGLMAQGGLQISVIFWLIVFAVNFYLIFRGITKGIEKFCTYAMPLMAICAFIVLIRVLTLGTPNPEHPDRNVVNGLGFMWNPQPKAVYVCPKCETPVQQGAALRAEEELLHSLGKVPESDGQTDDSKIHRVELIKCVNKECGKVFSTQDARHGLQAEFPVGARVEDNPLLDAETWLAAAGQIFFSLSVGFGIIINYASYLRRKDDIVLSGLTAASTNEFFEVCLGGLITIPAAFIFLGVAGAATTGTFDLGFKTLPVVFKYMQFGSFFGFIWFFMLFLAAITSSLSMLQPAIAFLEEGLGIGRKASVAILGLVTAMGSCFVIYFSKGLVALDTVDFWIGTAMIFVLAMVEVVLYGWVFGVERGYQEAQYGAEMRLPRLFNVVIKYIAPIFLGVIFFFWCKDNLPGRIRDMGNEGQEAAIWSIALIAILFVFLLIMIHIASKRWNGLEKSALTGASVRPETAS